MRIIIVPELRDWTTEADLLALMADLAHDVALKVAYRATVTVVLEDLEGQTSAAMVGAVADPFVTDPASAGDPDGLGPSGVARIARARALGLIPPGPVAQAAAEAEVLDPAPPSDVVAAVLGDALDPPPAGSACDEIARVLAAE